MSDAPQAWLPEYQNFRGLATLEIIIRHVTWLGVASLLLVPSPLREVVTTISASAFCALPQFIFISGVVLFNKYRHSFSLSRFYKKRVSSVLWPYLVFSTFYFFYPYVYASFVSLFFPNSAAGMAGLSGVQLIRTYLINLTTGSIEHLWFILLILQLYALYPLIVKAYNRISRWRNVTATVLLVLLGVQMLYTAFFVVKPSADYPFSHWRVLFISGIFYFVLGIVVCDHYDAIKQRVAKVPLVFLLVIVAPFTAGYSVAFYYTFLISGSPHWYVWFYELMAPIYSVLLIAFFLKISLIWAEPHSVVTRSVAKIGEDSFGIYLVHPFFIAIFGSVLVNFGLTVANPFYYVVVAAAVLVASYATVHAIYRLPFSEIIIGRPRKRMPAEPFEKPHPSNSSTDGQ
jgi:peptidoglycan/LPS O-acetylase OafA/YrhL